MMTIRLDFSLILALYFGLALFGIGFNLVIAHMERRGWLEGYLSLAVAFGVAVTLGAVAVVSWQMALVTAGAFFFSGLPMIAGSIYRHVRARESFHRALRGDDE